MTDFEILEPVPLWLSETVSTGIADFNRDGLIARENFAVVRGTQAATHGAITASVSFGVLFINGLWVAEERRMRGLGRILIMHAEAEGMRRGARQACVDTLSIQAPEFYRRLDYEEFGRISGISDGRQIDRIWFRKPLRLRAP